MIIPVKIVPMNMIFCEVVEEMSAVTMPSVTISKSIPPAALMNNFGRVPLDAMIWDIIPTATPHSATIARMM